jgi:hypothetical protein
MFPATFSRGSGEGDMSAPHRRYLGTWTLPSGNSCDVYLGPDSDLACEWDDPPAPSWPATDVDYYERVTFPAILQAVARATGQRVLGVTG